MRRLGVAFEDDAWRIVGLEGGHSVIRLGGKPVSSFLPGWKPRGASLTLIPYVLLDLVHESGREASWFLDGQLEHRANHLAELPSHAQDAIAERAADALAGIWNDIVCSAAPVRPAGLGLFAGINAAMRGDLLDLAIARTPMTTRVVDLQEAEPDPAGYAAALPNGGAVTLRAVTQCLAGNLQEDFTKALAATEGFACPSPVDGRMLYSRDSLILHEHRIAYRFTDERFGLVFMIGVTHLHFAKADLFIPSANLAFQRYDPASPALGGLAAAVLRHALVHAEALLDYLQQTGHQCAALCRGYGHMHIGHHLWNELTGLDRLVRTVEAADLPTVIVPDVDEGSEPFAPVDRIFPELAGRIDRHLRWPGSLARHVYAQGYCALRVLDDYVTTELSDRMRRAAASQRPTAYDQALASRLRAQQVPCILLGLRVENRTAIDLQATCTAIIAHLRRRLGRVAVILDGQNARIGHDPVSSFGSFGQLPEHEHPVFTELRLAHALHRQFAHTEVTLINLCGAAMSRSLFWAARSAFFVGFWGAGLAKYRWVCNRPGLVLSNRWNLQNRGDLGIYHAPRYQQGGAPMHFIEPAAITDDPDAPVLFSPVHPVPSYSNFRIDGDRLEAALDAMLTEHAPSSIRMASADGRPLA